LIDRGSDAPIGLSTISHQKLELRGLELTDREIGGRKAVTDRELIGAAAAAEREARAACRMAEMLDTQETWLAAAAAAREAKRAAELAGWSRVVEASLQAERDALTRAAQRG
jgi:hypothetical protein